MDLEKLQTIKVRRGDTQSIQLEIEGISLTEDDRLFFSVKKRPVLEAEDIIRREFNGNRPFHITLSSCETDIPRGTYYYGFRLVLHTGEVITLCQPSFFIIEEVVVDVPNN